MPRLKSGCAMLGHDQRDQERGEQRGDEQAVGARQQGNTPDEASMAAERYMADVKHIVVSPA